MQRFDRAGRPEMRREGRDAGGEREGPPPAPGLRGWLADRRVQVVGGVFAAVLALAIGGALLSPTSEEDKVRAVLDAIEEGIEAREVGDVMDHVHERYQDRYAGDRKAVKLFLVHLFFSGRSVTVQRLGTTDVELQPGGRALARFRAIVTEGSLADSGDLDFEVQLEKEDGDWKVIGHTRRSR